MSLLQVLKSKFVPLIKGRKELSLAHQISKGFENLVIALDIAVVERCCT